MLINCQLKDSEYMFKTTKLIMTYTVSPITDLSKIKHDPGWTYVLMYHLIPTFIYLTGQSWPRCAGYRTGVPGRSFSGLWLLNFNLRWTGQSLLLFVSSRHAGEFICHVISLPFILTEVWLIFKKKTTSRDIRVVPRI